MLCGNANQFDFSITVTFRRIPPAQLYETTSIIKYPITHEQVPNSKYTYLITFNVCYSKRGEPAFESKRHKPLKLVSVKRVKFSNRFNVKMVVVTVADDDSIDGWKVFQLARRLRVALRT